MNNFQWNGDVYPFPRGWEGLSIEQWFYRYESARDRMRFASDLDLPRMKDEDGDDLDPEEVVLIHEFGFRTGGHFEAFRNWSIGHMAQQAGLSPTDLESRMGAAARERIQAERGQAMSAGGGGLTAVEGVELNTWAQIQAALAGGGNLESMLGQAGIDRPRWDRVSAEWMNRMQTDTTATIATAYGNAFATAGQGQFGAAAAAATSAGAGNDPGAEPIPFERFVEIQEAMSAAGDRGEDPSALLAHFGLSPMDWGNLGAYWSRKMQHEATKYHQLYSQYSDKYRAQYRA